MHGLELTVDGMTLGKLEEQLRHLVRLRLIRLLHKRPA